MFCPKCGNKLNDNNICPNPDCTANVDDQHKDQQFQSPTENINLDPNNSQINDNSNSNFNQSYNNNFNSSETNNEFRDQNGISPTEMMEFLGDKNPEYYMDKWTRFQENPKFISWNWPSFLFGIYWFWFRKMYSIAGILFAVSLASTFLLSHFRWLQSLISLGIMIGSGLLANQLYMNHATQKIKSTKFTASMRYDDSMFFRRLRSIGGITWAPLFVAIGLFVLTIAIVVIAIIVLGSTFSNFRY